MERSTYFLHLKLFVVKVDMFHEQHTYLPLQSSPAKRIAKFAKYGFIQEIIPYLLQLLSKSNAEVTVEEKKQLSDMALHGLVYQLKQDLEQSSVADTLRFKIKILSNEDNTILSKTAVKKQC